MTAVISLGRLERVGLRQAWPNEASNFTPWLAEEGNLAQLVYYMPGLEKCGDKSRWDAQQDWLLTWWPKLSNSLRPFIKALDPSQLQINEADELAAGTDEDQDGQASLAD